MQKPTEAGNLFLVCKLRSRIKYTWAFSKSHATLPSTGGIELNYKLYPAVKYENTYTHIYRHLFHKCILIQDLIMKASDKYICKLSKKQ